MKQKTAVFVLVLGVSALFPAAARDRRDMAGPYPPFTQAAQGAVETVTGVLTIAQGRIALQANGVTYYAGGLNRYVGFIDGLKEGARVTLEGPAAVNPQDEKSKFLRVSKLTINGKTFDLVPPAAANAQPPTSPRPGRM